MMYLVEDGPARGDDRDRGQPEFDRLHADRRHPRRAVPRDGRALCRDGASASPTLACSRSTATPSTACGAVPRLRPACERAGRRQELSRGSPRPARLREGDPARWHHRGPRRRSPAEPEPPPAAPGKAPTAPPQEEFPSSRRSTRPTAVSPAWRWSRAGTAWTCRCSWLREVAGTDQSGTTLQGARRHRPRVIGLDVEPVKVSRDRLDDLNLPAIIHWDASTGSCSSRPTSTGRDRRSRPRPAADGPRGARPPLGRLRRPDNANGHDARGADGSAASQMAGPVPAQASPGADRRARPCPRGGGCEVALPLVVEHVVNAVISQTGPRRSSCSAWPCSGSRSAAPSPCSSSAWSSCGPPPASTPTRSTSSRLGCSASRCRTSPLGGSGDIERRLSGVREIRRIVIEQGVEALSAGTQVIVGVAIMFVLSPLLALVVPRRRSPVRARHAIRLHAAAPFVRRDRAQLRALRLGPDRPLEGHRDGEVDRHRGRASAGGSSGHSPISPGGRSTPTGRSPPSDPPCS